MDTLTPRYPHRIHARAVRPRPPARGFDAPFVRGASVALPASLLLWLAIIWAVTRLF